MTRSSRAVLLAAALALLAYRFAHVELAAFSRDEPQFLSAAREQLRTGRWLQANPLFGNMGYRYGPAAFWFYGAVQAVFGDDPHTAIRAMGLVVTLSQLAFAVALTRMFGEGLVFLAALVAWIASSPYHFLWSRLAWDLTSLAAVFAAAALLCAYRELGPGRAALLGLVLGLGLSTHPIVLPMAAAVAAAVVWELRARPRLLLARGGLMAGAAVAVCLPYLLFLSRAYVVGRAPRRPSDAAGLVELVLQAPRTATPWRLGGWTEFETWAGPVSQALAVVSVFFLALVAAATVAGLALALRAPDPRWRRLGRAAAVAWGATVALLAAVGLDPHPHYHFSAVWVPVFGVAALLAWLRRTRPRAGAWALGALGVVSLAQFAVVVTWMSYVQARGGTRTPSYGTAIGLQVQAMRDACAGPEPRVVVENETAMFRFPFEYLATTEAACREKVVVVCSPEPGPLTRPCPPPDPGARRVRLLHARDRGGAVRVVPLSPGDGPGVPGGGQVAPDGR